MHLTLLESDRSFFHSAECAFVSIVAHAGVVWFALAATDGGGQLPIDEREARVFYLLPPDRVDATAFSGASPAPSSRAVPGSRRRATGSVFAGLRTVTAHGASGAAPTARPPSVRLRS